MKRLMAPLYLFLILVLLGLTIRYIAGKNSELWQIWSSVDVTSAVALAALAFFAYRQMLRDDDEVRIMLEVDGKRHDTGLCLLRKDCTRSEIIGVLGMMQRRTKERFMYDPVHLHDLLNELNRVQKGKAKELAVPLSQEEFEQFVLAQKDRSNG